YDMTGNGISAAGARLSFVLAMRGPCVATDTACSSSLVATHLAARLIEYGECVNALSIGSSMILSARGAFSMFSIAGMLSTCGRCLTFDSCANGYQRGEGCVGIVNSSVRSDTESMHLGSSCLHNGQSATFTALNGSSQQHLIRCAGDIDTRFIEAHGTGTSLGDPVEIGSLAGVFESSAVSITSLKGNLGHMEGTAGAGGLLNLSTVLEFQVTVANA
ncbi:hypothetical protein AURANDRAFT_32737, partial [Aureococcus anophagefferens]